MGYNQSYQQLASLAAGMGPGHLSPIRGLPEELKSINHPLDAIASGSIAHCFPSLAPSSSVKVEPGPLASGNAYAVSHLNEPF